MEKGINDAIEEAKVLMQMPGFAPEIPFIVKTLEHMRRLLNADLATRTMASAGLGRLVLDNTPFAYSQFGLILANLANDFVEMK